MSRKFFYVISVLSFAVVSSCAPVSESAKRSADMKMHQPIAYVNAAKRGPKVIVLPGKIKSNNAAFTQKISPNNIADFAEIELSRANFGVLERSDLGPMVNEISLAITMGDPNALKRFKRGKFKSTKWFIKFDILRVEHVASAKGGFHGRKLGRFLKKYIPGKNGNLAGDLVKSCDTHEETGVWIVGLRYKILDASTTEQVSSNYFEQQMEIGSKGSSMFGLSSGQAAGETLDSLAQRLVQLAVADIDRQK